MEADWRLKKPSLQKTLGHIFATGLYSDVAFLVGAEGFRINASKTILCARSELFSTMFNDRWNLEMSEEKNIPESNKAAFKPFLNYFYTDTISFGELRLEDILEITHLAHMYQVHQLLEECIAYLSNHIDESNCLQIHTSCEALDKALSDKALQFFLENIVPTAKSNNAYLTWDANLVEKILRDDREHIPETTLFKALLKWKNQDPSRNGCFEKLIKFIRFPTMTAKDFATEVVTTDALSKDEQFSVLCYIATQSGMVNFPTKTRHSGKPNIVTVCDKFAVVTGQMITQMLNFRFHKLSLKLYNTALVTRSKLKLYGVKLFPPQPAECDLDAVLAYLESLQCTITVGILDQYENPLQSVSKTINDIRKKKHWIYFNSPVCLTMNDYSTISTKLEVASMPSAMLPSGFQLGRRPPTMSKKELVTSEGQCYTFEIQSDLVRIQAQSQQVDRLVAYSQFGGYRGKSQNLPQDSSLIHELIFSPPETIIDNVDCRVT